MLRLEHVTKHYKGFDLECSMEVRKGCGHRPGGEERGRKKHYV